MKLHYKGRNKRIKNALQISNKILSDPSFYQKISSFKKLENTQPKDLKPSEISTFLERHPKKVYVKTYIGNKSTNAKTKRSSHFKLNRLNLRRPTAELVRTMIHEYVHCVDFSLKNYKFTHKDNNNENGDENNTAPWAIGNLAYQIALNSQLS